MNIAIEVNTRELADAFRKAPAKTTKKIKEWVETITFLAEREEKQEVPVRTGALQNSVHGVVNGIRGETKPNIEYAIFVNNGTRRQKANPFADRTYNKVKPVADRKASNLIDDVVRSI